MLIVASYFQTFPFTMLTPGNFRMTSASANIFVLVVI